MLSAQKRLTTSLSKMQEETMVVAVAGQCWASAQTSGKPRNVNIHSPHWLTASHGWQLRSPCSPGHSSHLTQHSESRGNCSWAADDWTMGQLPLRRHGRERWRILCFGLNLERGVAKKETRVYAICEQFCQQSSFHTPSYIWRWSERKGIWRAKRGNGSEISPE